MCINYYTSQLQTRVNVMKCPIKLIKCYEIPSMSYKTICLIRLFDVGKGWSYSAYPNSHRQYIIQFSKLIFTSLSYYAIKAKYLVSIMHCHTLLVWKYSTLCITLMYTLQQSLRTTYPVTNDHLVYTTNIPSTELLHPITKPSYNIMPPALYDHTGLAEGGHRLKQGALCLYFWTNFISLNVNCSCAESI